VGKAADGLRDSGISPLALPFEVYVLGASVRAAAAEAEARWWRPA